MSCKLEYFADILQVFCKPFIFYFLSSPGPSHKLTFSILKTKFPDYNSIIWRDG